MFCRAVWQLMDYERFMVGVAAQGPLVQTVQNKNQWVKQQEQELLKEAEDEESDDKDDSPDEDGAVTVEDIDTHVNKQ